METVFQGMPVKDVCEENKEMRGGPMCLTGYSFCFVFFFLASKLD